VSRQVARLVCRPSARLAAATVVVASIGTLSAPSTTATAATTAARSAAVVDIVEVGKVGWFGSAVIDVRARCRAGTQPQELVLEVTQGGESGTRAGDFGLRRDGRPHRLQVEVSRATAVRSRRERCTSPRCSPC